MQKKKIVSIFSACLFLVGLALFVVLMDPQTPPTTKAHSASEEVVVPPEVDPWETAWANQKQYLADISTEAEKLRKELPSMSRALAKEVAPLDQEIRRLYIVSSTYGTVPRVLEAVNMRIRKTGVELNKVMAPALSARSTAQDLLDKVTQLEKTVPPDVRNNSSAGQEMRSYMDTLSQVKKRLTETVARLDNALTAGKLLGESIKRADTAITAHLPTLWEKYYISSPIRYTDSRYWNDLQVEFEAAAQQFSLRLPMEIPQGFEMWRTVGLRFGIILLTCSVICMILYRRVRKGAGSTSYSHIFRTSLPWVCIGASLMISSASPEGDYFRGLLMIGNVFLLIGQISLAWDLRCIDTTDLPRTSPLWPIFPVALGGYILMYPALPTLIFMGAWTFIVLSALIWQRFRRSNNCPLQYETTIMQIEPAVLWISLALVLLGMPRYAILLYMLFVGLAVAVQLCIGGIHLIHTTAKKLPEEGIKAVIGSIIIACAAPVVLLTMFVGLALWMLTLPGGIALLQHYAISGFSVGETRFNFLQVLLIISVFYITRTAVGMGTAFLRKMPTQGIRVDSTLIPPLQTAFTYCMWGGFGLFVLHSLGVALANLAVVAGGLSVGIGFGMQAIVNNFLSGLILIFSRTLQEGDVVDVGGVTGTVRKISVRATTVETYDNAVIYVPNSEFVSTRLINWTRNSRSVRREINVGVAYGSDTQMVMKLLKDVAIASPNVLKYPPPVVLFTDFGNSTLNFSLRFWVHDYDVGVSTASVIRFELDTLFRQHGIEVAFPQMDIHIRDMPAPARRPVLKAPPKAALRPRARVVVKPRPARPVPSPCTKDHPTNPQAPKD
ncbi:MAG: mechanosensitive ion channel [Desulfovibrionaceae bacterium]